MKNLLLSTLTLAGIVAFSSANAADPVKAPAAPAAEMTTQMKIMTQEQEGHMADDIKTANTACGSNITISTDWNTLKDVKQENKSLSGYCGAPAAALQSLCDSNTAYKTSIATKVKEIKCSFGAERKIEFKDGVINYTADLKSSNDTDYVKDYLNTKL